MDIGKNILEKLQGDKVIWMIVFVLSLFSVLAVYSSTGTLAFKYHEGNTEYYLIKHIALMIFGLGLMYAAHRVPYQYYAKAAQILLIVSIPLLAYTLFFGSDINQAKRWITLPVINISFQTSDLAKLALIMFLARVLSIKQGNIKDFQGAFVPILLPVFLVCALIAPADLSTAVVLFGTSLILMFLGRVDLKHILGLMGASLLAAFLFISFLKIMPEDSLKGMGRMATWKARIEAFSGDEAGAESYQVAQSKIAIAKGGILGMGPGNSTQRNFLPHPYSDFIYAIIIEEYGLIGGSFLVLLYLLFLFRSINIVMKSPKAFGALLAAGLSLSLVIQAFIHMGVSVNLLPVTGLTLPMVSMGGTSLFFTSISVGIILSVSRTVEETAPKKASKRKPKMAMARG